MIRLYYAPKTSSFRCRWMLEELGVDHELVPVDLAKGEHKRPEYVADVHPLGSVPALVVDGETYLESAAIVCFLADRDPERRFAPTLDDAARGRYLQWIFFAMTDLYAVVHAVYVRHFFGGAAASDDERAAFERIVALTDGALTSGPFLLGERFTAADVIVGGVLVWAADCGLLRDRSPTADYLARVRARPAFVRAEASETCAPAS
ncbi:MAG: glutathione S-transferase family protein [Myxococcales bacterium]|nr:glutathione S-transferase family protein [Myxococcales bacterium]